MGRVGTFQITTIMESPMNNSVDSSADFVYWQIILDQNEAETLQRILNNINPMHINTSPTSSTSEKQLYLLLKLSKLLPVGDPHDTV